MKTGQFSKKVSGGKLIRLDVTYSDKVEQVKITGDFFINPEDLITKIEENLSGATIPINDAFLIQKIDNLIRQNDATLIGISSEDIVAVLGEATK
jgi:lipoate-protein ligase A